MNKSQKAKVFISYARDDFEKASAIYSWLKKYNCDPWLDKENLLPGELWSLSIRRAIKEADFFLGCFSQNSVNKIGYFQAELKEAFEILKQYPNENIYVIPVRFDACDIPDEWSKHTWVDLFEPQGIEKLILAINREWERRGFELLQTDELYSSILIGKYYVNIEANGVLLLPEQLSQILRAKYGRRLYITNDIFNNCIILYPHDLFSELVRKVNSFPQSRNEVQFFKRRVIMPAIATELDTLNRLTIPHEFKDIYEIDSNCDAVVVGQIDKIEIWHKKKWDEMTSVDKIDRAIIEQKLAEYGL